MLGQQLVIGFSQLRKTRADFPIARIGGSDAGVPQCDAHVSHKAAPFCALHGTFAEDVAKLFSLSRLKIGKGSDWRAAIPRANILADIATENVMADRVAKFQWHGGAQFDGQV